MNSKKILSLILISALAAVMVTGCGKQENDKKNESTDITMGSQAVADLTGIIGGNDNVTAASEPSQNEKNEQSEKNEENVETTPEAAEIPSAAPDEIADIVTEPAEAEVVPGCISEYKDLVLLDNDDYFIQIADVDPEGFFGFTVSFAVENRTDRARVFRLANETINGLYNPGDLYLYLEPGEKCDFASADWNYESLRGENVTELYFSIICSDDMGENEPEYLCEQTIYPSGAENAVHYEYVQDEDDLVVIDDENARVIILNTDTDEDGNFRVEYYAENRTDNTICGYLHSISINGYMISYGDYSEIPAGLAAVRSFYVELGKEELKMVSEALKARLTFSVYDEEMVLVSPLSEAVAEIYPEGSEAVENIDFMEPVGNEMVYEDERMAISVVDYVYDPYFKEYLVEFDIINKSESQFILQLSNFTVNDFCTDELYYECVEGKSRAICSVGISFEVLGKFIDDVLKMEFEMIAASDWPGAANGGTEDYYLDMHTALYPNGKEAADSMIGYSPSEESELFLDNAGVVGYVTGYRIDSFENLIADFYFENQNDYTVEVYCLDSYVDGNEIFCYWNFTLPPKSQKVGALSWGYYSLDEFGIDSENIGQIDLTIQISNGDNWDAGYEEINTYMNPHNIVREEN